jgi:hypothetical protein
MRRSCGSSRTKPRDFCRSNQWSFRPVRPAPGLGSGSRASASRARPNKMEQGRSSRPSLRTAYRGCRGWATSAIGRISALQARFDDLEVNGLALLYPALEWNVCVPGHHGHPRASDLILGKALKGRSCHQITDATARPFLHLLNPTRRRRQEFLRLVSC